MASKKPHYNKNDRKVSKTGGNYVRHDRFWAQAKDDGYAARSVYKLQEMDAEHHVLFRGARVIDLGCAPGSWLQWAAELVGPQGRVVGVDLEAVTVALPPHVTTLKMDMYTLTRETLPADAWPVDVVLSDLAPHTTGIRSVDQDRAFDLSARAVLMGDGLLKVGGNLVVKTFEGPDTRRLENALRLRFGQFKLVRPKATRKQSAEVYLLAKGFHAKPEQAKDPLATL